jgi:hypothetical protein
MSDLTEYTASQFINWLTQGQINQAPSQIYVGLINDIGKEISGGFLSGRIRTVAADDWGRTGQSKVVNENQIVFSDAQGNFFVDAVALFESDINERGEELIEIPVVGGPVTVLSGNDVRIDPTELEFDMLNVNE